MFETTTSTDAALHTALEAMQKGHSGTTDMARVKGQSGTSLDAAMVDIGELIRLNDAMIAKLDES